MAMSYHYVHNHPNIYEANPLLPHKPELEEFILQKGIISPIVAQNFESSQIRTINILLTLVIIRNHHIYTSSPVCIGGANYHVDGTNLGC